MKRPTRRAASGFVWHLPVLWGCSLEPGPEQVQVVVVYVTPGGITAGPQAAPLTGAARKALPAGSAETTKEIACRFPR